MTDELFFTLLAIGAAILFIAVLIVFYVISKKISNHSELENISKRWLIRIPFSMFTSFWMGSVLVFLWWQIYGSTKFSGGGEGHGGNNNIIYYAGFILLCFLLLLIIKRPKIHLFLTFVSLFIYTASMTIITYLEGVH